MSATAASSITWEQYNETGRRLFAEGDLAGAEDAFVAAIAEAERGGGDPLQLASSLGNLAQLKYQQKDHLRAEELFRRSLELREQSLGSEHPSVLTSINNLAALYVSRGALDEAEPLLKRAMGASAKRVESAQTDLGVNLNNLARLYFKRGDYRQAEPLLVQLLTLKRPYGPEHPEVATVLVSLAKVRHSLGKPDQAERLWRRVLIVRERQLPASDPAVLQAMDGLSDSLAALGKHAAALDLRERALKAREETMGADHPTVAQQRARVEESRAATAAAVATTTVPVRPRLSAEVRQAPSLTPPPGTPIQATRSGLTPAASSARIPTPTQPKPAAPPPVVVEKAPDSPVKNDLGITEAWADDPELPPPKPNRVSEPVKRVSQAIPVAPEPPKLELEQSIAPAPKPERKSGPKAEVQLGVTQVFERPKPTPPPMPAVVAKTPTPPPMVAVAARTPTPPPVSTIEQPAARKPRIGFGTGEGSKNKMIPIAVGAIAAVLIVGAIIVIPKMGHSAPARPSAPVAQAAAPSTPAPAPAATTPVQAPVQAAPATPAVAEAVPEAQTPAPAQSHEGFSAHMGPANPPAAAADEPDSSTERVRPAGHGAQIRLSRGAAAADAPIPSAPTVNLNLDQATKAIDSTTKNNKKKPEIAAPSF